jgi:hypothetical protein
MGHKISGMRRMCTGRHLARDRDQGRCLVSTIVELRAHYKKVNSLTVGTIIIIIIIIIIINIISSTTTAAAADASRIILLRGITER